MGKGLVKKLLECKHPSSRKTLNLIRKTKRINNRQLKKIANASKTNIVGKKLFWFYEQIEDSVGPLSPEAFLELINLYLKRFDDELEQIRIKHNINKKRGNQHAARESSIQMTLEKEINDFNGGGLELPDLCDEQEFNQFQAWCGDASKIQHLNLKFISKSMLMQMINTQKEKFMEINCD